MTDEYRAKVIAAHRLIDRGGGPVCSADGQPFPCEPLRSFNQHTLDADGACITCDTKAGVTVAALCNTFWGSHGCDRPRGHDGPHICGSESKDGPCSQVSYEDGEWVLRYWYIDTGELSEPSPTILYRNNNESENPDA